jgi:PAS domain S-box-containing protein
LGDDEPIVILQNSFFSKGHPVEEKEIARIDDDKLLCLVEERPDIRGRLAPLAESGEESLRLLHKLQVHQIELEMQNDELRQARTELEAAREKYTDLYEFAPVGYLTLDRAGSISSVNLMGSSLIKIGRSQLIGLRFVNFLSAETCPPFADFLNKVFTSLVKETFETTLKNMLFVQIEALAVASGQECRITLTDITGRKRTEEELLSKNLILTTQMETTTNGILVVDENDTITLYNRRLIEMWGLPPELLDTKREAPVLQFIAAQVVDAESFQEQIRYLYAHRDEKSRDDITLKDGRIFERYSAPLIETNGKYFGREWYFHDITEIKESFRRIRDSEIRYRRLFESSKDGILIIEAESGLIFDVNPYLCEILGFSSEDFIGKHLWEIGAFKDIAASKDAFRKLQEKEYICYDDLPLSTKDGRKVEVEFVSNVYLVDKIKVIQCNIRDITENRKLEAQLRQSQKMEAVGQLAGGIAHDFNNILSAILGFSSLVQMNMAKNDPSHDDMEQIIAAVDRGADLTKSLLAFSRKQVMQPAPVNLNELILKVGKFLGRIIGEDIALETTFKKETLTVNVDSGQIEQVLMNLATNARDAMPAGGCFSIITEAVEIDHIFINAHKFGATGRYALIKVTDTGTGMDAATTARIFEPFFSTKDVGKGTGLGLSIVYGIIKQHNGFINIYSEPGIGTTFRIYLPLLQEKSLEERAQSPSPPIPRGTETILLAEDDTMIRNLTKGFLTDFGYTVITATDGEDAIGKFKENKERIQLLLFDVIMPKKNGKDAYDEIKKSGSNVRAIFVSGYLLDVIYKKGLQDERCDLVMKPVSPQNLLRKIREVLDRQSFGKSC